MNSPETKLYLVDDHQIIIDGLQLLISSELGFKIVGSANDSDKAYKDILYKKPDIALVDLKMTSIGMAGIELINRLKKQVDTKFVILSMYNEWQHINDAINYGACGYLLKNTGKKELIECINKVIRGEKHFPAKPSSKNANNDGSFTPRELEILKLVVADFTTQDIARQLHLSHYTIETHRKNICRKTGTKTVVGLLKYISENNINI